VIRVLFSFERHKQECVLKPGLWICAVEQQDWQKTVVEQQTSMFLLCE
jgi:hypothetical protein